MARYIDADALEMELCRETFQPSKYCYPCREVLDAINGIPTADVREVKRGRWEPMEYTIIGEDPMDVKSGWRCSICHRIKEEKSWYCPNCGAEMEGEYE